MTSHQMESSGILVDGRKRAAEANREEIEQAVRARYSDERAAATGRIRRWRVKRKIRRDTAKALERIAPTEALYVWASHD